MNTLSGLAWISNLENLEMLVFVAGGLTLATIITMRVWKLSLHFSETRSLRKLAEMHYKNGQYAKAEPLYQQALVHALQEKDLSKSHPDVAQGLNNLAEIYAAQGQFDKAEPLYKRALVISEKAFGPHHPEVAQCLNNLAVLYDTLDHYIKAEPLYRQSLAIWDRTLGPNHPKVVTARLNYAALLRELNGAVEPKSQEVSGHS
ncbi:MAG: tetratricopeptide repeat protein [Methylococcales bacterium]|nr:tetratricopeptide repeat protein [Methylococcales bacterium]